MKINYINEKYFNTIDSSSKRTRTKEDVMRDVAKVALREERKRKALALKKRLEIDANNPYFNSKTHFFGDLSIVMQTIADSSFGPNDTETKIRHRIHNSWHYLNNTGIEEWMFEPDPPVINEKIDKVIYPNNSIKILKNEKNTALLSPIALKENYPTINIDKLQTIPNKTSFEDPYWNINAFLCPIGMFCMNEQCRSYIDDNGVVHLYIGARMNHEFEHITKTSSDIAKQVVFELKGIQNLNSLKKDITTKEIRSAIDFGERSGRKGKLWPRTSYAKSLVDLFDACPDCDTYIQFLEDYSDYLSPEFIEKFIFSKSIQQQIIKEMRIIKDFLENVYGITFSISFCFVYDMAPYHYAMAGLNDRPIEENAKLILTV